ncbi:MAG: SDR family oxidoreductase [Sphingobium sp.]|nr:SDR family oxidoreductase [Sphingobium sp.]MCP5398581.1 SDR family oxidoreductase [Sphingomonas sp.]
MAQHMLIIGMGYTGGMLASALRTQGWRVTGVKREADGPDILPFADEGAVRDHIGQATHILSSVPPTRDGDDPVLALYGDAIAGSGAQWVGYLSSTGVYGDTGGAWVDEGAPIGTGRRTARADADARWQKLHPAMRVFRLPGIYGPGRSALDRVRTEKAHRIDIEGQIFSRIHVDDIIAAIIKSFDGPAGVYNIADDHPCPQNDVIAYAAALLGLPCPPLQSIEEAGLSPQARAFYAENRRVANGKAKRLLGWRAQYPDYRRGLTACLNNDE